jgi:peptidoglycan/xylan/chitin deacetylase (PgdA/CDA1 family)
MRVTSHCANHPSKEAGSRCSACRKWMCEDCLKRYGARVYCGRKCQLVGSLKSTPGAAIATARRPVHPAWAIAVTGGASAILLWAVGLKVAELVEIHRGLGVATRSEGAEVSGEIAVEGDGFTIEVRGEPGVRVLVVADEQPLRILTLDDNGRAEMDDLELEIGKRTIRLVPLSGAPFDLEAPLLPTMTATSVPTSTATAIAAATAKQTPQSSKSPIVRESSIGAAAGPTPVSAPPVLQLVHDAGPRIAITFDGNASSNRTAELLDLLQHHDLKVTLFVTGEFIERYPAIVRRAVLAGHEIGNHTYSHPHLTTYAENNRHRLLPGVTRRSFQNSLRQTEQAFRAATGRAMQPLWRAPFGEENRLLRGWALELGYLHVRWSSLQGESLDSRDWIADEHSSLYQSSSTIMERLLGFPELEGGIILMHLATERSEPPWAKLPEFLEALEDRGLEPTQVTRLLESSNTWSPWLERAQARHRENFGE